MEQAAAGPCLDGWQETELRRSQQAFSGSNFLSCHAVMLVMLTNRWALLHTRPHAVSQAATFAPWERPCAQLCKHLESSFKVDRKREGFDVQLLRSLG